MDERDFYIFGEPIETKLGQVRFLTYREYLLNISELSLMTQNVLHMYYQYLKKVDKDNTEALDYLEEFKKLSLFQIVHGEEFMYDTYMKIFQMLVVPYSEDGNEHEMIMNSEDLFMQYRKLVMDMNLLSEEAVSPNPEIQKGLEMSRETKQLGKDKTTFTDIVSSIVAGTANSFKDVCSMTVYQVYSTYYRMGAIFDYQTSTLFATVSEKVNIESWGRHLDLYEKESHTIKAKEFNKKFGGMF